MVHPLERKNSPAPNSLNYLGFGSEFGFDSGEISYK